MNNVEQNELLICACRNTEHQVIFSYFDDELVPEVYMSVHLTKKPFWSRVKHALKYVFGYQSKYGAFDEFILDFRDAHKIKKVYEYLNKNRKHYEK